MLLRHASGYLAAMLVQALAGLVLLALLTRLLPADQFGRYALALAVLQIAGGPAFHWCRALVTRFLVSSELAGQRAELLETVHRGLWATGAAVAAVLAAVVAAVTWSRLIDPAAAAMLWAILPAMLLQAAFQIRTEVHRAALRLTRCAMMISVQSVLGVALSLLLAVPAGLQATGAVLGLALSCAACLLIDRGERRRRARPLPWTVLRPMLGYSLPLTLIMGLEMLLQSGDRFVIAYLLGNAAVAAYAAPQTLAARSIANLCAATAAASLPIVIATLERLGPLEARRAMRQAGELMLAATIPCTVAFVALAGPITDVMIGPALRADARSLLPLIAVATLMNGLSSHYVAHGFQLARRTMRAVWVIVPAVVLGLGLDVLLVPQYGVVGAGYALLAAQFSYLALSLLLVRRSFALPIPWAAGGVVLAASLLGAAAARALPLPPGLAGTLLGGLLIAGCAIAGILASGTAGIGGALRRLAFER